MIHVKRSVGGLCSAVNGSSASGERPRHVLGVSSTPVSKQQESARDARTLAAEASRSPTQRGDRAPDARRSAGHRF
jgi:hypothetical protein